MLYDRAFSNYHHAAVAKGVIEKHKGNTGQLMRFEYRVVLYSPDKPESEGE